MKKIEAIRMAIKALEQEPCEDVAKERYEDLCEYFGGAKDILKNRGDFKAWLGRVKWHIHKAEELSEENDDLRDQLAMRDRFQKQEPCEDAISRRAVVNILDDMVKDYINENDFDKAQGIAWVKVQKLTSVNPQPKTGEWQQDLDGTYLCSECGSGFKEQPTLMGKPMFLWCPLCGAKMVEPQESEI